MEPFEQRLHEEHAQLKGRLTALSDFLGSEKFKALDTEHQVLLRVQHAAMVSYWSVLCERIELLKCAQPHDCCTLSQPDPELTKCKPNPLQRPATYHLIDCLKELKFGRPVNNQEKLDEWIAELQECPENGEPFR